MCGVLTRPRLEAFHIRTQVPAAVATHIIQPLFAIPNLKYLLVAAVVNPSDVTALAGKTASWKIPLLCLQQPKKAYDLMTVVSGAARRTAILSTDAATGNTGRCSTRAGGGTAGVFQIRNVQSHIRQD